MPSSVVQLYCQRCGGTASGNTEQEARDKINHSQAMSRGIACGDNYNQVIIVGEKSYEQFSSDPDIIVKDIHYTVETTDQDKTKPPLTSETPSSNDNTTPTIPSKTKKTPKTKKFNKKQSKIVKE